MQKDMENTSEKEDKKRRLGFRGRIILPAACAVILTAGGVTALHTLSRQMQGEKEASRLHISSNYLEEDAGASYTVADWGDGFDILLYNYEKEDMDRISGTDMTYKVTADHGTVRVKKQNGEEAAADGDSVYTFEAEHTAACQVLHVTPDADAGRDGKITVTVQTASPSPKTLTAEFQVQNFSKPDYTVTDQKNGTVLVTVNTNDYQDSMTVTWEPDRYSPDPASEWMSSWEEGTHAGYFPVSSNSTYELLFHKKTDDPCREQKGTATEITLD